MGRAQRNPSSIGKSNRWVSLRSTRPTDLRPLHETIDHLLLAGFLERDGELVAVDFHHVAVAEFLVKHAVIEREFGMGAGGFRYQFALDHHRPALVAGEAAARIVAREGIATRARGVAPRT